MGSKKGATKMEIWLRILSHEDKLKVLGVTNLEVGRKEVTLS